MAIPTFALCNIAGMGMHGITISRGGLTGLGFAFVLVLAFAFVLRTSPRGRTILGSGRSLRNTGYLTIYEK